MKGRRTMRICLLCLLCLYSCLGAEDLFHFSVQEIGKKNLLTNSDFQKMEASSSVSAWIFKNYSEKPGLNFSFIDDTFQLQTTGGLFGYLMQEKLTVVEGAKYCVEVQLRLNSRALLWIVPVVYDQSLTVPPPQYKKALQPASEKLVKELSCFINPEYLVPISETQWNQCALEFTVPKNQGIHQYDFRIGAYGGEKGWLEVKKPFFGLAGRKLLITLTGKDLVEMNVCQPGGKIIQKILLKPTEAKQQFYINLDSRLMQYYVEIVDQKGEKHRRSL